MQPEMSIWGTLAKDIGKIGPNLLRQIYPLNPNHTASHTSSWMSTGRSETLTVNGEQKTVNSVSKIPETVAETLAAVPLFCLCSDPCPH